MSWDWKTANGIGPDSAAGTMSAAGDKRPSPDAKKGSARTPDTRRSASIAWRTAGWGSGLGGGNVELVDECEHKCPFCRGRGEIASGSKCPTCNGRKTVHVEPPSVRCAFCGGQGQMPPRSNLSCWVCKGKGLIPVKLPVQACPDCQGKGKMQGKSLYCPRCRGVGVTALKDVLQRRPG